MKKTFKQLLKTTPKPLGIFVNTGCPEMVEITAQTGFQFVIIDNEHGSWDGEKNSHMIRAAESFNSIPLVRVSSAWAENEIKHVLDCGAAGVVVPGITSAKDAAAALENSLFAPTGSRGACPYVRANSYTGLSGTYFSDSNRNVAVIMMIEGSQGVKNFEEIISLDGVDTVFFGPYDLSVSLGIPGQTDDPRVEGSIRSMIKLAAERHVSTGMLGVKAEDSNKWFDCGVDFVVAVGDMALFYRSCCEMVQGIHNT